MKKKLFIAGAVITVLAVVYRFVFWFSKPRVISINPLEKLVEFEYEGTTYMYRAGSGDMVIASTRSNSTLTVSTEVYDAKIGGFAFSIYKGGKFTGYLEKVYL